MKLLVLSSDIILIFKQKNSYNDIQIKTKNLGKKLKIKFIAYFIISTRLLLFFWYYISMFCVVYMNNQYHLLKNALISFGLSLLYPFVVYLLAGLFRSIPLSGKKRAKNAYIILAKFCKKFNI